MIVIGLTGSIAMGKSEVAKVFRSQGIPVFDADQEVHKLYDSAAGAILLQDIAPDAISAGKVDRRRLAECVTADPHLLSRIEPVVHAEIARRRARFISEAASTGHALAVVDVPLLFETGGDKNVDLTIVVSSTPENQRQRALARPGMTEAKLEMILKRQMPDADKRKRADIIIDNNATLEALRVSALAVIATIKHQEKL